MKFYALVSLIQTLSLRAILPHSWMDIVFDSGNAQLVLKWVPGVWRMTHSLHVLRQQIVRIGSWWPAHSVIGILLSVHSGNPRLQVKTAGILDFTSTSMENLNYFFIIYFKINLTYIIWCKSKYWSDLVSTMTRDKFNCYKDVEFSI